MGKLTIHKTPIDGLMVVETDAHIDSRGAFRRLFCDEELASVLSSRVIRQINHSHTVASGTVRGMHYQENPFSETKLVRCLRGRVFDVAVDLRRESSTFLQWFGVEISSTNSKMLVIPERFAHGFQTLEQDCELLYLHTQVYRPGSEGGLRHDDPKIGISWPLPTRDLSERDRNHPLVCESFRGLE